MSRILTVFVIAVLAAAGGVLLATSEPAPNAGSAEVELLSGFSPVDGNINACGVKPIKPIPPIGCKDLVAQCVCDDRGRNCGWTWACVPS